MRVGGFDLFQFLECALVIAVVQKRFGHQQMELRRVAADFNETLGGFFIKTFVAGVERGNAEHVEVHELIGHFWPQWFERFSGVGVLADEGVAKSEEIAGLARIGLFAERSSEPDDGLGVVGAFVFEQANIEAHSQHFRRKFFCGTELGEGRVPILAAHFDDSQIDVSGGGLRVKLKDSSERSFRRAEVPGSEGLLTLLKNGGRIGRSALSGDGRTGLDRRKLGD